MIESLFNLLFKHALQFRNLIEKETGQSWLACIKQCVANNVLVGTAISVFHLECELEAMDSFIVVADLQFPGHGVFFLGGTHEGKVVDV